MAWKDLHLGILEEFAEHAESVHEFQLEGQRLKETRKARTRKERGDSASYWRTLKCTRPEVFEQQRAARKARSQLPEVKARKRDAAREYYRANRERLAAYQRERHARMRAAGMPPRQSIKTPEEQAKWAANRRAKEQANPNVRAERLRRRRAALQAKFENPHEREEHLAKKRAYAKAWRAALTDEQRAELRRKNRERRARDMQDPEKRKRLCEAHARRNAAYRERQKRGK